MKASPDKIDIPVEDQDLDVEDGVVSTQSNDVPEEEQEDVPEENDDSIQEEPHTSFLLPLPDKQQFATPSKDLPALKDIESITTPKAFDVAKDVEDEQQNNTTSDIVASSPIKHKPALEENQPEDQEQISEESLQAVAAFLSVDESAISSVSDSTILKALISKSADYHDVLSQNEFLKLKLEQNTHSLGKQLEEIQNKYTVSDNLAITLQEEKETLQREAKRQEQEISELRETADRSQKELSNRQIAEATQSEEFNKFKEEANHREIEYQKQLAQLSSVNITKSKELNEMTKEVNKITNENFSLQLDLAKSGNELSYLREQKEWYETELKSAQTRFTDLIKKHESEIVSATSKISTLSVRNETLENLKSQHESTITDLRKELEKEITKKSKSESEYESEKSRFLKEISSKQELIELTKLQSEQRASRIAQLDSYIEEIKTSMGDTISNLESKLSSQTEKLHLVEEKLRRTEEVLDAELHKETDLPKLTDSSSMIAANGISLSTLYSEYNHLKKQLVMERSQKEKIQVQLESFIHELDARKPAIANYREQIQFYENSVKELVGKVETIRSEKAEVERDAKRLRNVISENENELLSVKKLLKDLGRQLCFYLIHSKIRDGNENPLTIGEKRAIEKILDESGKHLQEEESDTDKLISERLLEFKNIIELRTRNEELLVAIRSLSKQLESREDENNALQNLAVEEAKNAILTLESELDSLNVKLDAVTQERDALRSINGGKSTNTDTSVVARRNEELVTKIKDCETIIAKLREDSSSSILQLNEKLRVVTDQKNELALEVSVSTKSTQLAESRLSIAQKSLEDSRAELVAVQKEIDFWKEQTSKYETKLVSVSEQLHQVEETANQNRITVTSLQRENEFKTILQASLQSEIDSLKNDKTKLNEFVLNLQSMVKEREESSKEIANKLNASIDNYQLLQKTLFEKEERIYILTNQSELALKAQNTKLEQVNEISQQLLETKNKLLEKERLVEELKNKLSQKREVVVVPQSVGDKANGESSSFEVQQLKEDLRIAESQVEELSNLAKASETTLINASNSFQQFKIDSDAKQQELVKQKGQAEEEIRKINELYTSTCAELDAARSTYSSEMNELKSQLNEFKYKAEQYDNLDKNYREKLDSIGKDLEAQSQLYNECHDKYQNELAKTQTLNEQISGLKDQLETRARDITTLQEELELSKKSIAEVQNNLALEKSEIETNLSVSDNKISELKLQNELLLNQLELTKNSSNVEETSTNAEDLRQVIYYLRREKETIEAELQVAIQENQKLQIRVAQIENEMSSLNSSSSFHSATTLSLDASLQHQKELSNQLEQLNVFRESNSTLRQENKKLTDEIQKLKVKVVELGNEVDPLKEKFNEVSANLEFEQQKSRLLDEENQRVKVLSVSTDEEKEDERKKLLENISRMENQMSKLKEKANQKILEKNDHIAKQDEKIKELTGEIEKLTTAAATSNEDEKLKKEIETLNGKLKTVQQQSDKVLLEKNELTNKLNTLEANLRAQFEKEKSDLTKPSEGKSVNNEALEQLQVKNKQLEELLEKTKKEFDSKLEAEKETTREHVQKKFELKMKMLTRKVEKYEQQDKTLPAKPTNETTQKAASKPVGHPGNESTLTVHRPTLAKTDSKKSSPAPDTKPPHQESRKRGNDKQHHRPQVKKPKDS
ncbi:LOW QUALITY PROTEIN: MLP1 Protein MLP1 [Candida maltosa Xu316]